MSEADRNGQIRLAVDQEVFIETVERDHVVDDANVATEVTSFERVGDAYVLEGAIVFAGYLTRNSEGSSNGQQSPSSRHIHHRMPFTLRVPVQFQPRGVVNVASRISDWQLDVISEGWVRVRAKLLVTGLNGKRGYHFQCGAQEDGDVLFGNAANEGAEEEVEAAFRSDDLAIDQHEPVDEKREEVRQNHLADANLQLVRGQKNTDADEGSLNEATSRLSEARGGATGGGGSGSDAPAKNESKEQGVASANQVESASVREELLNLDRLVQTGESETPAKASASGETATEASGSDASARQESSEFEFQHQVDLKEVATRNLEYAGEANEALSSEGNQPESFVASRSFSEEGFQATAGFVPTVRMGTQAAEAGDEEPFSEDEERSASAVDTSLWSFVDFNAPDGHYTIRYVIVMEEESIATVAERVGCSETELMRTNRVSSDAVFPGQVLKVPDSFSAVRK